MAMRVTLGAGVEMQNFTPAYMKGFTYVRTIFPEPKFLGCIDNQIFLPMVLRCARENSAIIKPGLPLGTPFPSHKSPYLRHIII